MTIDMRNFYAQSKIFEDSAVKSAIEKAKIYEGQSIPTWKANSLSRKVAKVAFEDFKKNLESQFKRDSEIDYSNFIDLVLQARTNYFFHSLPENLKDIILGQQPSHN